MTVLAIGPVLPILTVFTIFTVFTVFTVLSVLTVFSILSVLSVGSVLSVMDGNGLSVAENQLPECFPVRSQFVDGEKLLAPLKGGDKLLETGNVGIDAVKALFNLVHPFLQVMDVLLEGGVVIGYCTGRNKEPHNKKCFRYCFHIVVIQDVL